MMVVENWYENRGALSDGDSGGGLMERPAQFAVDWLMAAEDWGLYA